MTDGEMTALVSTLLGDPRFDGLVEPYLAIAKD